MRENQEYCDCPVCNGALEGTVFEALNNLISAVFMVVLTIDQQTHRSQEIKEAVQPKILAYLKDNAEEFQAEHNVDLMMSRLAAFTKKTVEEEMVYRA